MKAVQIEIDKSQVFKIIDQLDENDRFEIYSELKKSLFIKRFNNLLKTTQKDDLSMDEITKEVESVRKRRYEKGGHII